MDNSIIIQCIAYSGFIISLIQKIMEVFHFAGNTKLRVACWKTLILTISKVENGRDVTAYFYIRQDGNVRVVVISCLWPRMLLVTKLFPNTKGNNDVYVDEGDYGREWCYIIQINIGDKK